MAEFVPLIQFRYQLDVADALHRLGDAWPHNWSETIEIVAPFCEVDHGYKLAVKNWSGLSKRLLKDPTIKLPEGFGLKRQDWEEPEKPDCPDMAREFLTALALMGWKIEDSERAVREYISSGDLPLYGTDRNTIPSRLSPDYLDNFEGPIEFALSAKLDRANIDYFLAHGVPRSVGEADSDTDPIPPNPEPSEHITTHEDKASPLDEELTPDDGVRREDKSANDGAAKSQVSRAALRDWYKTRHDDWPKDQRQPSRKKDIGDAKSHFGQSVSRTWLRTCRKEIAPEWTFPGAPKTKK